jgi:Asp-tRNA(Asn)/Glu-tRNA(Gln) amidotransferase A subunit family amidase
LPDGSAIITRIDAAMEQARVAEAEIMAGRYRGPLHGIPWGIKDWFYTQGVPTTFGQAAFEHHIVNYNATVIERLQEAGAILIAKLSPNSDRQGPWFGGKTRNPWDLTQGVADGSSAGSATATAAGLLGFSIGEENTGSIVWPSLFCGAVGLRPTFGRVSRFGMKPGGPTMEKVGPICRSVEDCALVFNAIYGPDGEDWAVVDAPFQWRPRMDLAGTRVGYIESAFEGVEDQVEREVYEAVLAVLRGLGATLIPIELPYPALYEQAAWLTNWVEGSWEDDPRHAGFGHLITAADYLWLQRIRALACRDMSRLFMGCEVLIYPGKGERYMWATSWIGYPALAVPCGFIEGLPCGITFVGKAYDEAGLLSAGFAYEQATAWHERHPTLKPPS